MYTTLPVQYLGLVCQRQPQHLVFAVAQEAVCVQDVVVAVQAEVDGVVGRLGAVVVLRHEADLRGGSAQVQSPRGLQALRWRAKERDRV